MEYVCSKYQRKKFLALYLWITNDPSAKKVDISNKEIYIEGNKLMLLKHE